MLPIPRIDDYSRILTDVEVNDFVGKIFYVFFDSIREVENLRKVTKLLYIFLTTPDEVDKYVQPNSYH